MTRLFALSRGRHFTWQLGGVLVVGALLVSALGAFGLGQRAFAAGETYAFKDANTIRITGGKYTNNKDLVKDGDNYTLTETDINGSITWTISGVTKATNGGYTGTIKSEACDDNGCNEQDPKGAISISDPGSVGPGGGGGAAPAPAANQSQDICDNNPDHTELDFWVCAATKMISRAATQMDLAITDAIKIDTDQIFNDSGNSAAGNAFFVAWAAFRNIAYAILIIFALVMIASQILNMDFVDAYTFRKLLPRLIIAVILIALSWNGMDFIFHLANDASDAIRDLIKAPFTKVDPTIGNTPSNDISLAIVVPLLLTVGTAAGAAVVGFMGVGGVAALLGTVVLSIFSTWVILISRNVIAELLIIMSPIAIVLWALGR